MTIGQEHIKKNYIIQLLIVIIKNTPYKRNRITYFPQPI